MLYDIKILRENNCAKSVCNALGVSLEGLELDGEIILILVSAHAFVPMESRISDLQIALISASTRNSHN